MPTIIVSYRREDTAWIAGRIHDRLRGHYGAENVFMDIDSIPFGLDFREHIHDSLKRCDILLAIVGPRWIAESESGQSRLHDENDWVRIEIEGALAKKIPLIPVLIDGAKLPPASGLPEGVRDLVFRQAADVDAGRDFHPHMDRLIGVMDQLLARKTPAPTPEPVKRSEEKAPRKEESDKPKEPKPPPQKEAKAVKAASASATGEAAAGKSPQWKKAWHLFTARYGRLARGPFALGVVAGFAMTALLVLGIGIPISEAIGNSQDMPPVVLIFPLVWVWTLIALGSKRLHDLGWDAWPIAVPLLLAPALTYLLGIYGALGAFVASTSLAVLALLFLSPLGWMRGTAGPNRFGPDPLGETVTRET